MGSTHLSLYRGDRWVLFCVLRERRSILLAYLTSEFETRRYALPMPKADIQPHEIMYIYRKRKNITQLRISIEIHSTQVHVSRIERGVASPTPFEQKTIEELLGVRIWNKEGS
jgi:hypothetical protein